MSVRNILAVYGQATDQERGAGHLWYTRANATAQALAMAHDLPVCVVAGIISALSPRNRWENNLKDACRVLQEESGPYTAFRANVTKAESIRSLASGFVQGQPTAGDVLELLGQGPKTRAFFWNIYTPDATEHVTIDGHATTIAEGKYRPLTSLSVLTKRRYAILSDEYRRAAALAGTTPNIMQATTWLTWRRIHGIG